MIPPSVRIFLALASASRIGRRRAVSASRHAVFDRPGRRLHADYHEPSDEPKTLDYAKLARATTLIGDVAAALASLPERLKRDRPLPPIGEPCV
jgi:hypothetical protein